jgi:hypothetical protein
MFDVECSMFAFFYSARLYMTESLRRLGYFSSGIGEYKKAFFGNRRGFTLPQLSANLSLR